MEGMVSVHSIRMHTRPLAILTHTQGILGRTAQIPASSIPMQEWGPMDGMEQLTRERATVTINMVPTRLLITNRQAQCKAMARCYTRPCEMRHLVKDIAQ